MKHFFLLVLTLTLGTQLFAQDADPRLSSRYSKEELLQMMEKDPQQYKLLVYACDHACYITDLPNGKSSELSGTLNVDLSKPLDFIALGLEIKNVNQYFRINGTDKMLVVKSEWVLNNELSTRN